MQVQVQVQVQVQAQAQVRELPQEPPALPKLVLLVSERVQMQGLEQEQLVLTTMAQLLQAQVQELPQVSPREELLEREREATEAVNAGLACAWTSEKAKSFREQRVRESIEGSLHPTNAA